MSMQTIHQQLDVKIECCCHVDITDDCQLNVSRLNINHVNISKMSFICECQLSGSFTRHLTEDLNHRSTHSYLRHRTQS